MQTNVLEFLTKKINAAIKKALKAEAELINAFILLILLIY